MYGYMMVVIELILYLTHELIVYVYVCVSNVDIGHHRLVGWLLDTVEQCVLLVTILFSSSLL